MERLTVRDEWHEEQKAIKRLLDAGVKPDQLATYETFGDVYVFAHGCLRKITPNDVEWYNHTYRIGVLASTAS